MHIASRELPEFVSLLRLFQERYSYECGGMPVLYSCFFVCSDSSSGSGNTQCEQKEVYRGWGDVCTVIISESIFISLTTRSVLLTSYPCIPNSQFTPALLWLWSVSPQAMQWALCCECRLCWLNSRWRIRPAIITVWSRHFSLIIH